MIIRRIKEGIKFQDWLAFGLVVLMYTSPSFAVEEYSTDYKQIKLSREVSNQALAAHDIQRFSSFFDVDYVINYGSSSKTLSRDAEIASLRKLFTDYPKVKYVRTPEKIDISQSGTLAMEHGSWIGGNNSSKIFSGKYTAGWRKTGGVWKIHIELFVTLMCKGPSCE